jgi:hypothetical protein
VFDVSFDGRESGEGEPCLTEGGKGGRKKGGRGGERRRGVEKRWEVLI